MSSFRVLFNLINKRYAGHSKWANIKHIKALKDSQRSAIFTKLSRQMKVAIQEGGSTNPEHNLKLFQVIEQAKRNSMPMATIQNVIKSTKAQKDNAKSGLLEIRGPSGCVVLCEVYTDNLTRLKQNVSAILKKDKTTNFQIADGSGRKLFEQKGIIQVENPHKNKSEKEILEIAEEHAIESGAEDVKLISNDELEFVCEPKSLRDVQSKIEELKYKITSSEVEYIPTLVIELPDKDLEGLSSLCERLGTQEEIVNIYDNIG